MTTALPHYRVKPVRLDNDLAEQWATYLRDGHFWRDSLEYVPVGRIDFDLWNPGRYEFYLEAFRAGRVAEPVRLSALPSGRYSVGDGNHRCAASKALGYPTVPAIVTRRVEGKPSAAPPSNLYEKVYGGELCALLIRLRARLELGLDFLLDWGDPLPTGYWLKVVDERAKPYRTERFEVVADGDERSVDFRFHGRRFAHRWTNDDSDSVDSLVRAFVPFLEKAWAETEPGRTAASDPLRAGFALHDRIYDMAWRAKNPEILREAEWEAGFSAVRDLRNLVDRLGENQDLVSRADEWLRKAERSLAEGRAAGSLGNRATERAKLNITRDRLDGAFMNCHEALRNRARFLRVYDEMDREFRNAGVAAPSGERQLDLLIRAYRIHDDLFDERWRELDLPEDSDWEEAQRDMGRFLALCRDLGYADSPSVSRKISEADHDWFCGIMTDRLKAVRELDGILDVLHSWLNRLANEVRFDRGAFRNANLVRTVASRFLARVELPPDRWVDASPDKLDRLQGERLWDLYHVSYGTIGMHIPSLRALLEGHDFLWVTDVDGDGEFDAFIAYKRTPAGNKIALMGSDGSQAAKRAVITKCSSLLKSSGWYAEISHRPAELMEQAGVAKVDDEALVRRILGKDDLEWLGDGKYRRTIRNLGPVVKSLYGHPRTARVASTEITRGYLGRLLARAKQGGEGWSEPAASVAALERMLKYARTDQDFMLPQDQEGLFASLDSRGVPPWELEELRRVPVPKVRTVVPRLDGTVVSELLEVTGLGLVSMGGDLTPAHNSELRGWLKAFRIVRERYPVVWGVLRRHARKLGLDTRGRGTEDASWDAPMIRLHLKGAAKADPKVCVYWLVHELGHAFRDGFDLLEVADLYGPQHPPCASEYGERNIEEDFAEAFASYWLAGAALRRRAPAKYEDMHRRLAGA